MKYTLAILFVLFESIAFGQKYNVCEIYRYEKNDSTHQSLECTRVFNKTGNIVHEVRNYAGYYDGLDEDFYRDGTKDYYYEKGLLRLIKYSGFERGRGVVKYPDTIITRFYYDNNKRLNKEIEVHRIYGCSGLDTVGVTDDGPPEGTIYHIDTLDSTMTIYDYDKQGKMVSKKWYDSWNLSSSQIKGSIFFEYDSYGRKIVDSLLSIDRSDVI
jgi:hypothetical protein